jgi:Amt family ammonium transporter
MADATITVNLFNNLWVLLCGALVFIMTISVGLLEIGELGTHYRQSLLKTIIIICLGFVVMAFVGFNTAFAPTIAGIIGNPLYSAPFLGGFSTDFPGLLQGVWWSMGPAYFNTDVTLSSYFFFETAFAAVTLALVGVIVLRKMKLPAFCAFAVVYFIIIWNLPAAWIWNPTGWLYNLGMRDFAGGLVVHGAAAAAGCAIVLKIWQEEKKKGYTESPKVPTRVSPGWITLAILLLWLGWFGFNPGSTLTWNHEANVVVLTTFLCASASFLSMMLFKYWETKKNPDLIYAANGVLMGLIVITPLAGFVSPASSVILGIICGPLFIWFEKFFAARTWFTDPVGLFPGHLVGGLFGVLMIAFFTQHPYAVGSGNANLPDGLLFGGGSDALQQLGIEILGIIAVMVTVFVLSYLTISLIGRAMNGITTDYEKEGMFTETAETSPED